MCTLSFLILLVITGVFISRTPLAQWQQRFCYYHTSGLVDITYNGKAVSTENLPIFKREETNKFQPIAVWHDQKFQYRKGEYGENLYRMVIPAGRLEGYSNDIVIDFGCFNPNDWQVLHYHISVKLTFVKANQILADSVLMITCGDQTMKDKTKTILSKEQDSISLGMACGI